MQAVVWHGYEDVRVEDVPDPRIEEPTDAIVRITSTGLCGSDLHLYSIMENFLEEGDVLGHEPMGIVEEVGPEVQHIAAGDRVVVPFNIACGRCFMCGRGLHSQCETTQNTEHGTGGSLFGYTKLYGQVPGGQAEYLRVPQAQFGPVKVPHGPPDTRFLYLSDVLPTAWQAVEYADIPAGGSVAVFGLGPIGQMCARIAAHRGARVIGVDLVPERLAMAESRDVETIPWTESDEVAAEVIELTDGRGTDSVIDAVGTEAHGSPVVEFAQKVMTLLPDRAGAALEQRVGSDRMVALLTAIETVRRGGTISIIGVYVGATDPLPMMRLFDKQVTIRMGQANVRRWVDDILPLLDDADPLGTQDFATHLLPLSDAPEAYSMFQNKEDQAIKVIFQP
ncbi:MAG TPA: zinc-dependent alcohol dehydrogenase [Gaiella sp.]|jgi:threonine dehydrogenase-like Zn-dependent dehydrogenase